MKLVKYFDRLMAIEVAVDHGKHFWQVEIRAENVPASSSVVA